MSSPSAARIGATRVFQTRVSSLVPPEVHDDGGAHQELDERRWRRRRGR